jgi:hypothetical protein
VRAKEKGFPFLMRKFISSFGGLSVKAITNRDFVGVRIWLTPPLRDLLIGTSRHDL